MAPTTVKDSVNDMYTEDGFYDTENDYVLLTQNASIGDTSYTLYGDTIEYDQFKDLGKAMGHVKVVQKDTSMTIFGKYAEFQSKTEASFVTDSAFAVQRMDDDTLYLFRGHAFYPTKTPSRTKGTLRLTTTPIFS
jgi:lipopolysaccharide assembly outer membrane protein LptD (OstA)